MDLVTGGYDSVANSRLKVLYISRVGGKDQIPTKAAKQTLNRLPGQCWKSPIQEQVLSP